MSVNRSMVNFRINGHYTKNDSGSSSPNSLGSCNSSANSSSDDLIGLEIMERNEPDAEINHLMYRCLSSLSIKEMEGKFEKTAQDPSLSKQRIFRPSPVAISSPSVFTPTIGLDQSSGSMEVDSSAEVINQIAVGTYFGRGKDIDKPSIPERSFTQATPDATAPDALGSFNNSSSIVSPPLERPEILNRKRSRNLSEHQETLDAAANEASKLSQDKRIKK